MQARSLIALLLLGIADGASAAHITDKLVVGMYPQPAAEGSPLKLLSSGTPLEVLQDRDGYSEVRLADDTRGWVASTYVTEEKPARAMLLETQARLRQMGLELAALREKQGLAEPDAEGDGRSPAARETPPSAREAQLRQALGEAEARMAGLERQLADRPVLEDAQQRLELLRERTRQAAELLAEAQGLQLSEAEAEAAEGVVGRYRSWIVGLIMLLVGFGAGVAYVDYRLRKRHGGFRV